MNGKFKAILYIALMTAGLLAGGCSQSEMANVSIDLGLNRQARMEQTIFDRVIAFFSMSTAVTAEPVPSGSLMAVSIMVTGPGMPMISNSYDIETNPVIMETGVVRLLVPAGLNRLFVVKATWFNGETTDEYGSVKTTDLPADDVLLNFTMGMLPDPISYSPFINREGPSVSINFHDYINYGMTGGGSVNGILIFRARGGLIIESDTTPPPLAAYKAVGRLINPTMANYTYDTTAPNPDYVYWYRFAPYNIYGAADPTSPAIDSVF